MALRNAVKSTGQFGGFSTAPALTTNGEYPPMADESIRLVPLNKPGWFAIIDNADYEDVTRYKWKLSKATGYVYRCIGHSGREYLHRFLMKPVDGKQLIDHANGDKLDNRRSSNLRFCDKAGNARNSSKHIPKTSRFKGVFRETRSGRWIAKIMVNRRPIHIGAFRDEIQAAKAYDGAARRYFGEFARVNFSE